MVDIIAIISLMLVSLGLMVERYFYNKKMTKMLDDSIKASLSRNINDYIAAKASDDRPTIKPTEADEIELENASEEEFNKFLKTQ